MELGLEGKSVAITGGTAGIGKAMAQAFLKENCRVAVCSRNGDNVAATVEEFRGAGHEVYGAVADVTDYESIRGFACGVEQEYGTVDVWINNAGNNYFKMIVDFDIDEWKQAIDLNLNSAFFAAKAVVPVMRKNGGGVILNNASYAGLLPPVGKGCYAAAKSGLLSLTRSLAGELAPFNIRVAALVPGATYTRMTEENYRNNKARVSASQAQQRIGDAGGIAAWAVFVASDKASYFTGTHVEISGGKYCVQDPASAWVYYRNKPNGK